VQRLELETRLRIALANPDQHFVLHYQPQINLRTGELIGTEALVRWQHPEWGLLLPDAFISLAEATGLIKPLGEWVLRTACVQNKAWQDAGLPAINLAVNLSAHQFGGVDMVELTRQIVQETGLDPHHLELELTETAAMADAEAFIAATSQLKGLSITLTIDDFGTGFSSLSYLQRFPIDRLKIDTSFIHEVAQEPASAAVARAIISLAHDLGLIAVAEGVETEAQLQFLRRHGCDEMQGFYFSPAIPADALADMLRQGRRIDFSPNAPEATRRVLCVDDEPNILSALRRLFRRDGYQVLVANSGVECLEIMATEDVGVVIVDARMPEMDGAQLLSKVRQLHPNVVRMMLSGYTDLKAVTDAVNRGELFRFMTKPWEDAELLEALRAAFNYHDSLQRKQAPAGSLPSA
jgi:EAL domain-containing protein (putative c-di-GMP-specific phosphodiesterase class I)/ActR/RegA family two-component response regulator